MPRPAGRVRCASCIVGYSSTTRVYRQMPVAGQKRDYYEVLGVAPGVGEQELKSAYRKIALQYHPDRNPGNKDAEERFKEASEAYEVLSNPDKRARYDRFGHAESLFDGFGAGFCGPGNPSIVAVILGDSLGGGRGPRRSLRGCDLPCSLGISFEAAATGCV